MLTPFSGTSHGQGGENSRQPGPERPFGPGQALASGRPMLPSSTRGIGSRAHIDPLVQVPSS